MRWALCLWVVVWLAAPCLAESGAGRVIKVLPQFLDREGRAALSPSLYERDAYQARLRQHPEERSSVRFVVQWKAKGRTNSVLKLRTELRGISQSNLPRELRLEQSVEPTGWRGRWTTFTLLPEHYKALGEVTAWRVTLWEGERLLGEQHSFLW